MPCVVYDILELRDKIVASSRSQLCKDDIENLKNWNLSVDINQSKDLHREVSRFYKLSKFPVAEAQEFIADGSGSYTQGTTLSIFIQGLFRKKTLFTK